MGKPIAVACDEANLVDQFAARCLQDSTHDPQLLRFSLRQLLASFVILSLFCAVIAASSVLSGAVIVFVATIVTTHIIATIIGTRLQAQTNSANPFRTEGRETAQSKHDFVQSIAVTRPQPAAPCSPWHVCGGTAVPGLRSFVAGTAILGGSLGAYYLAATVGDRVSPIGIAIGGCSIAVLGGWFAFLFSNFYCVFRHGFRDAIQCDLNSH